MEVWVICGAVYSPENTVIQPAWPQGRSTMSTLTCHSTQALTSHLLDSRSILKQYAAQSLTMYCKLPRSPTVHTCYSPMAGHEIGKKWSVIRDCFGYPKTFWLAIYPFFGVLVPQFGLTFSTWHTAIFDQLYGITPSHFIRGPD